ncbi:MAG: hypothetical protein OSA97_01425 [Nevskia sp.]|nr:hypothetical protein [Nevskia sp.]
MLRKIGALFALLFCFNASAQFMTRETCNAEIREVGAQCEVGKMKSVEQAKAQFIEQARAQFDQERNKLAAQYQDAQAAAVQSAKIQWQLIGLACTIGGLMLGYFAGTSSTKRGVTA